MKQLVDTLVHKWLRVPYSLYVAPQKEIARPRLTVVLIHGIGNSSKTWTKLTKRLPKDVRVIAIDLLGFGQSPSPEWAVYNAKTQARSIIATLLKQRIFGRVVIVGHSLGSLVAIEVAKRYKPVVSKLILCSPPLYRSQDRYNKELFSGDEMLRRLYAQAIKHPKTFFKVTDLVTKYKMTDKSFHVDETNVASYMATLQAAIINQTSLSDAQGLKVPIVIIRGRLDPLVLTSNIKILKNNKNVHVKNITASHDLSDRYVNAILAELDGTILGLQA